MVEPLFERTWLEAPDAADARVPVSSVIWNGPVSLDLRALLNRVYYRYPSFLLDTIAEHEPGVRLVAMKNVTVGEEFFQGHFPGSPLMPGVLMIEGAAQAATFLIKKMMGWSRERLIGLAGLNEVRFRGQVVPPARVYFVSAEGKVSGTRLARFPAQAWSNGELIMDMELLGVLL